MSLGVHPGPPSEELEPFVESRRLPENLDPFTDSQEERALKLAFRALQYADRITHDWPWLP